MVFSVRLFCFPSGVRQDTLTVMLLVLFRGRRYAGYAIIVDYGPHYFNDPAFPGFIYLSVIVVVNPVRRLGDNFARRLLSNARLQLNSGSL